MHREVYCFHCKDYSFTDQPVPICRTCKSVITGERLTGANDTVGKFPSFQGVNE